MNTIVNSREDLESLSEGKKNQFMQFLAGSIWRAERDEENEQWVHVKDINTISRFGFTESDFPNAPKPNLPEYVPTPPEPAPRITALQGLLAIDAAGLAEQYEAWSTDPERTFAEKAFINRAEYWHRDDPILIGAATTLGLSEEQIDDLFEAAAQL